jgi:acylphosphatase
MAEKTVQVRITGRVQGVSYRAWTQEAARARGLSGWVRNCADGAVEAVFAGPSEAVDAMLAEYREGPPAARVEAVQMQDVATAETGGDFQIRY